MSSIMMGEHEWLPVHRADDKPVEPDSALLPLGHCIAWGIDDSGLVFQVQDKGDPEWMRHVFQTLHELGVPFLAGIHRCSDKADLHGPEVLQFCVILSTSDRDEFMPRVMQAYDIAEAVTGGVA